MKCVCLRRLAYPWKKKKRASGTPEEELIISFLWPHFWAGKCAAQKRNNEEAEISAAAGSLETGIENKATSVSSQASPPCSRYPVPLALGAPRRSPLLAPRIRMLILSAKGDRGLAREGCFYLVIKNTALG